MEFTVRIDAKAVLRVFALGAIAVGSFYAGVRYQEHKSAHTSETGASSVSDPDPYAAIAEPIKAGDNMIIPESKAAEMEASWCKANPDTKWTIVPAHGVCDQRGTSWDISDKK